MTWNDLVVCSPVLAQLESECRTVAEAALRMAHLDYLRARERSNAVGGDLECSEAEMAESWRLSAWYHGLPELGISEGIDWRVRHAVGWFAEASDPVLQTSAAYDLAKRHLLDVLMGGHKC